MTEDRLDLAELAAALVVEVRDGVTAATRPGVGLQVVAGRIRVGQHPETDDVEEDEEEDHDLGTPLGLHSALPQRGWEVELQLDQGVGAPGAAIPVVAPAPTELLPLWAGRRLGDVKGIDAAWGRRLGRHGLATIGDLAALDQDGIAAVVGRERSMRPLEFHTRVGLLHTRAPRLGPTLADDVPLDDLVGIAPGRLRRRLGPQRCSASQAHRLFAALAAWSTAVDLRVLGTLTLAEARPTPIE